MRHKVKLVDNLFRAPSLSLGGGDQSERTPKYIEWDRTPGRAAVKVWTNGMFEYASNDPTPIKTALLIEPPGISPEPYTNLSWAENFDYVLTHNAELAEKLPEKARFYPFGGAWVEPPVQWPRKTKVISQVASSKTKTEGHIMRHQAAELGFVHTYGENYGGFVASKQQYILPYMFHLVIENERVDWWFTEKLIDAMLLRAIPVYWGCPSIGDFFDPNGIIVIENINELENILPHLNGYLYNSRRRAAEENFFRAKNFICAEDWIFEHHPETLGIMT